jgi:hypothetical protein
VSLLAAESTASQHSTNNSSGASIGVGFAVGGQQNGFTVDFAVNKARGNADGDDLGHVNSHVNAGNLVVLSSGGDTTLKGGVVAGKTVVADIGGDLKIESLQDRSTYDSKQVSAGLGLSVCVPPACYGMSGSVNYSQSKVKGDYLSVLEQSGITAGDGGFQVNVEGNTDLKGGLMSSSAAAVDSGYNRLLTGSLTATDLKNKDNYSASGFAVSASVSNVTNQPKNDKVSNVGKPVSSGGIGGVSGSQGSTTVSGISGGVVAILDGSKQELSGKDGSLVLASVDRDVTTENAAGKAGALGKAWDAAQLQKEVQAQVAITQAFSAQAPKAIAKYANERIDTLSDQLEAERDPEKRESLKTEIKNWKEGGFYRTALHAVSGGLTGGFAGAAGAAAVAKGANELSEMQDSVRTMLQDQGLSQSDAAALAGGLAEVAALAIGSVVGDTAGALTALTTDTNNRQLHEKEIKLAEKNGRALMLAAKKNNENITEEEAIARIERQLLRWVDKTAYLKDGGRVDELVMSVLGMTGKDVSLNITWDYRDFAKTHADEYNDASINIQNVVAYSAAFSRVNAGLTPQQVFDRNNQAGAPIAKALAMVFSAEVVAAATPVLAAMSKSALQACQANIVYCLNRAGIFAGEMLAGEALPAGVVSDNYLGR